MVLTDEEAVGFEEQLAFNLTRDGRDGRPQADVARAYNEHRVEAIAEEAGGAPRRHWVQRITEPRRLRNSRRGGSG